MPLQPLPPSPKSEMSFHPDAKLETMSPDALTRETILDLLRSERETLIRLGVRDIALFGSFARGEQTPASDVDILVDLADARFDTYMDVKFWLEGLFGRPVDLVVRDAVKPRLRKHIIDEAIRAA
jgi:predicted nucleotidyltransferase